MIWNLHDKNKYVVHIRTLQIYLKRGLKPKKMHRAIKFEPQEYENHTLNLTVTKERMLGMILKRIYSSY